jgi:hypothetical protein
MVAYENLTIGIHILPLFNYNQLLLTMCFYHTLNIYWYIIVRIFWYIKKKSAYIIKHKKNKKYLKINGQEATTFLSLRVT